MSVVKKKGKLLFSVFLMLVISLQIVITNSEIKENDEIEDLEPVIIPESSVQEVGFATAFLGNIPGIQYWPIFMFGALIATLLTLGKIKPKNIETKIRSIVKKR